MTYLMEHVSEGSRLLAREVANPSLARLREAGLRTGMAAADVGCGAGAQLPAMLELVGTGGSVVGVDPSLERLAQARQLTPAASNLNLSCASLPSTGLESSRFDFVWSQFVLEYLADPSAAVAELVRLTKPGGRVSVSEIDGLGLYAWPMPEVVAHGIELLLPLLEREGFDMHIGRKMYSLFRQAGLRDISVRLWPLYVAAGQADVRLIADWKQRFTALRGLGVTAFGSEAAWDAFCRGMLELFASPDALKYAVLLVTTGVR